MTRLTESGLLLNNGHAKQMKMRTLSTVIAVLKSRTFPKLCALDQLGILFKAALACGPIHLQPGAVYPLSAPLHPDAPL